MKLLEKVFKGVVASINLQNLDKALGLFLGIIEGIALTALVVFVLRLQPVINVVDILSGSLCVRILEPLMSFVVQNV
jgi:membrane protein required for colicin V production